MLSWELHATFVELHPLWSTTPDQGPSRPTGGCATLAGGVHAPIDNKRQRGYTSGAARPRQQVRHYAPFH